MRFNPKLAVLAFATTAAVASFGVQASSIDVKVTGNITPGACTPTLAGGGTIDYGTIGAAEINQATFNVREEKTVPFSINCDALTKVAIRAIDNRATSVVPGAVAALPSSATDALAFGLGSVSSKNVGSYIIMMKPNTFTADGANVIGTYSNNSGVSWTLATGRITSNRSTLLSWSTTNTGSPIAFKDLSGTLAVQAVLNKGSDLTLTSDVPLDGLATLELVYL